MSGAEETLAGVIVWLRATEWTSVLIIGTGFLVTLVEGIQSRTVAGTSNTRRPACGSPTSVLACECQLASDILATAVAPDWEQLGRLAAIRAILNLFLQREQREMERKQNPHTAESA